jgi:hypothetical protein
MTHITKVNDKSVRIQCDCGVNYNHSLADYQPEFVEDFGQYVNLRTQCPDCNQLTFFNMNLPETADHEAEVEAEPYWPDGEKEARERVRQVMWKFRPDLKGKDRAELARKHREQIEKRWGADFETVKGFIKREAAQRLQQ